MKIKTGRMQGGARFILQPLTSDHKTNLEVIDTKTGIVYTAIFINETQRRSRRWRIKIGEGDWRNKPFRYFEERDFTVSLLRQEIESLPEEEQHLRNNVEAAIFQYSFHTRNNKTRYRGLFKHRLQAVRRSMWMNLRRIAIHIRKMDPNEYNRCGNSLHIFILRLYKRYFSQFFQILNFYSVGWRLKNFILKSRTFDCCYKFNLKTATF